MTVRFIGSLLLVMTLSVTCAAAQGTEQAKPTRSQGAVMLSAMVEAGGTVSSVIVVKGISPEVDQRAIDAVKQWKFKPNTSGRHPVRVQVLLSADGPLTPAQPITEFGNGAHRFGEPGLVMPVPKQQPAGAYGMAAMRAKIEGEVGIEAVVLEDGTVGDVRVTKSLDTKFGLDEAALDAVTQWVFEPARFNGVPARVVVQLSLAFRLHR